MKKISKSKYTSFVTCPKQFWLNLHKPELAAEVDAGLELRFEQGNAAGEAALGLFDGVVNVKTVKADGALDIGTMCEKTQKLMAANCAAIAEASFSGEGVFCAVDILRNNGDGTWDLYEVKSSTSRKTIYLHDIAFQRYALGVCGIKVRKCNLVYINNQYIRQGEIDPRQLFVVEEISGLLPEFEMDIPANLAAAQAVWAGETEPSLDISENCNETYPCAFYGYCSRHLPEKSVFDLYRLGKDKKFECYKSGIVSYEEIRRAKVSLNDKQKRQLDFELDNKQPYVDKPKIQEFLDEIKFPVYYLDFETYQSALPLYDGFKPYQQIPFQYSLHIQKDKNAEVLEHREFLADENKNEWRALAEQLVRDIPKDGGTIISYNASFELSRIKEMADAFPDLSDGLLNMIFRMVDLLDVFRGGYYYNKAIGGSFSIKSVLPALFPANPEYSYKSLEIQGGTAAALSYLALKDKGADREKTRKNLMLYCGLDTLAMVAIHKELCALASEGNKNLA